MRILIDVPPDKIVEVKEELSKYFSSCGFERRGSIWIYSVSGVDSEVGTIVSPTYNNGRLELEVVRPARIGCAHFGSNIDFPDADLFLFGIPSAIGYSFEIKP